MYRVYNDVYTGGHSCSEWKVVTWSVDSDWGRSESEAKVIKENGQSVSFESYQFTIDKRATKMCCNGEKLLEVVQAEVRRAIEEAGLTGIPALMEGLEGKVIPMLTGRVDSLEREMEELMAREPGQAGEEKEELRDCDGNCALEESTTSEASSNDSGNSSVELEEGPKVEPEQEKEMKALQVKKDGEETQAEKVKSVREVRKTINELKAMFSSSDTRRRNIEVAQLEMEHNPRVQHIISLVVGDKKVWKNAEMLMMVYTDFVSSRVFGSWASMDPGTRRSARDSSEFATFLLEEEAERLWPGSSGMIAYRGGPNAIDKVYYDLYMGSGSPIRDNKGALMELVQITGARRLTIFGKASRLEVDIRMALNNLDAAIVEQVINSIDCCLLFHIICFRTTSFHAPRACSGQRR